MKPAGSQEVSSAASSVVVVGGGIGGLVAAWELTRAGYRVTVLEGGPVVGGTVARAVVDGLAVDVGAESFAVGGGAVRTLIEDLGLGFDVESPRPTPAWVRHRSGSAPLPAGGWLGIPSRLLATDLRRVIGWPGVLRATADRLLPAQVGRHDTIGAVVRARMGSRVLDRLVEPVIGGVYSTPPTALPVARLPPRAREALAHHRTLAAAADAVRGGSTAPGAQVAGLRGGMFSLVEGLVEAIRHDGGRIATDDPVTHLGRDGAGWRATTATGAMRPDGIVLAVPAAAGRALLGAPPVAWSTGEVLLCSLVVRSDALNVAPRGTGLLVSSDVTEVGAKAITHATAKWSWLAEAAGSGRHVLRLSYGRIGSGDLPGAAAFPRLALADAAELLGVPLDRADLLDWRLDRWPVGGTADTDVPIPPDGMVITGGWAAGTGLAAVVAHARTAAAALDARIGVLSATRGQVPR
ncbi:MAG: FAD-dependent oxidoreductase [Nakamurella sp.]